MEQPLSPREFLRRHRLPQLVRINNAHLHQLNASRPIPAPNTRSLDSSTGTTLSSASLSTSTSSSLTRHQERRQPLHRQKATATFSPASGARLHHHDRDCNSGSVRDAGLFRPPETSVLDIDQPFLLYKAYSSRQVLANPLTPDATSTMQHCEPILQKTGPALLIPESYPGEFH
jgi:hypothetical protein